MMVCELTHDVSGRRQTADRAEAPPGARAAIATPILRGGELLGALVIQSTTPGRRFDGEDARLLELLAASGAALLLGLERARLEGVLLAARTAQHELNNK